MPSVKKTMGEYVELEREEIPEYKGILVHLVHQASGARIIALENDDTENFFCFGFATAPLNDHGTAHILEHTVLCGSQRYRVKDPFLLLLRGSMQSFLNAMTYPDRTLYPAASPLEKDFFNLMSVYGDAVFFPLLKEEAFCQEGHRLMIKGQSLQHSGVVFNEMKGVYSSHDNFAADGVTRSLFPNTAYRFDSGGNPQFIPEITWRELQDFHRRCYHPSNCRIFLYGHIPLEKKLEFLHNEFLFSFQKQEPLAPIPIEKDFTQRHNVTEYFAAPKGDSENSTVSVNWRLGPVWERNAFLKWETLNHLLLGSNGAPFYYALQNSHLGEDVSPISGMAFDFNQVLFTAALRQVPVENEEKVEDLVYRALHGIVKEGIPHSQIEAALSSVEFSRREMRSGSLGLRLARRLYRIWQYDQNPFSALFFENSLAEFKKEALQKGYFESILEKNFLQNDNASTVITRPDFTLLAQQQKKDRQVLKERFTRMSQEEKDALKDQGMRLHAYQKQKDADNIVPALTREDVPKEVMRIPWYAENTHGISTIILPGLAQGIYYWKLAFALNHLNPDELIYLPLLCRCLGGLGWQGVPYDEASRQIVRSAASFSFSLDSGVDIHGHVHLHVIVTLKALPHQLKSALDVMMKTLLIPDFNVPDRIREIVLEFFNDNKAHLSYSGSSLASLALVKNFSPSGLVDEQWHGAGQMFFLHRLLKKIKKDNAACQDLIQTLERLHRQIFHKNVLTVSMATDEHQIEKAHESVFSVLKDLPAGQDVKGIVPDLKLGKKKHTGYIAASQVNFVGMGVPASHYGSKEAAAEQILANYLASGPLWERVRMKGGAYGVQAHLAALDHIFMMTSYRDPHVEQTWQIFEDVLSKSRALTQHKLDQALISLVGREIRPAAIEEKLNITLRRSFSGINDDMRQIVRQHLLLCTVSDLHHAMQRLSSQIAKGQRVVVGPEEQILAMKKKHLLQVVEKLP